MTFPNLWNNDQARAFFKENGYPEQYNDGLLAYLRETYPFAGGQTLPDLLARYLREYGDTFNMIIAGKSAVAQSVIQPASTFTAATPTDGGSGTIVLPSAGAHGLTSAVAVGYPIYISSGTGWTPGFYPITNVAVDTTGTVFTIAGTFNAGMGAPTIALANTEVTLATVAIPPLEANSILRIDSTYSSTNSSATQKVVRVKLDGTAFSSIALTTSPNNRKVTVIHNRGATNSQVAGITFGSNGGEGNTGTATTTGTVDTSIAQSIFFTVQPAAANIPIVLERYFVEVFK